MTLNGLPCLLMLFLFYMSPTKTVSKMSCKNSSLPIKIDFQHNSFTKISAEGNISRYIVVNWTLHGANVSNLDGYLIRMQDTTARTSIKPFEDADASVQKFWIHTNNETDCSDRSSIPNDTMISSEVSCWCNSSSCNFLNGLNCNPSTRWLRHRHGEFYAVPNTRTSIMYKTKYRTQYGIELYPYYRQFTLSSLMRSLFEATWSCADDLAKLLNITDVEGNLRCCEYDIATFTPLDIQTSELMLDPKTRTLNISISWIPSAGKGFAASSVRIYPGSKIDQAHTPQLTDVGSKGSYNENTTCTIHNRRDFITAYNILPNMTYSIHIHSWHSSGPARSLCRYGGCTKRIDIRTNFDPCSNKWSGCNIGSICVQNYADGEPTVPLTTCQPQDYCQSNKSICVDTADCYYNSTTYETTCACRDGFEGDGVSAKYNGTGCECESPCNNDKKGNGNSNGSEYVSTNTKSIAIMISAVLGGIIVLMVLEL